MAPLPLPHAHDRRRCTGERVLGTVVHAPILALYLDPFSVTGKVLVEP
jgi:hypothetical protein